jgi:hypothetical protein
MQEREEEGCWNITIGYVFIQEPDESGLTCTLQESQNKCDFLGPFRVKFIEFPLQMKAEARLFFI